MMLHHLGEASAAQRLRGAIERVMQDGKALTPDLGGSAKTKDYVAALKAAMQ